MHRLELTQITKKKGEKKKHLFHLKKRHTFPVGPDYAQIRVHIDIALKVFHDFSRTLR